MARIQISETQFVFAFFHKYLSLVKEDEITFVFPTLRQEGDESSDFAGADLVIDNNLFFQFKMPEYLRSKNAGEVAEGKLPGSFMPFYRMPIKNSPNSCQFNLLQKAAKLMSGSVVQYISPMFHTDKKQRDEDAFLNYFRMPPIESMKHVCSVDFSQFINPDTIQPQDDTHNICYNIDSVNSGTAYLFSEPKPVQIKRGISGYDGQSIRFTDNPKLERTVQQTLRLVTGVFDLPYDINTATPVDTIKRVQIRLIAEHNIFWVPIVRNLAIRRKRVASNLIS